MQWTVSRPSETQRILEAEPYEEVVRRSLVSDEVEVLSSTRKLWDNVGRIAQKAN